jgi:hypothetical protein
MVWHVKHNRALSGHLVVLRAQVLSVSWVERPHIPQLLLASKSLRVCPAEQLPLILSRRCMAPVRLCGAV